MNQDPVQNLMRNLTPRRVRVLYLKKHLETQGGVKNAGEVGVLGEGRALVLAEQGIVEIVDDGRER